MTKKCPKKLYLCEKEVKTVDGETLQIVVVDRSENKEFNRILFK